MDLPCLQFFIYAIRLWCHEFISDYARSPRYGGPNHAMPPSMQRSVITPQETPSTSLLS